MKRIKENITTEQYKVLLTHLQGDTAIRIHRKQRLLIIYSLLYYTGLRVNECTQFTDTLLKQLIDTKTAIVKTYKTKRERVLYITDNGQRELKKLFGHLTATDTKLIQSERLTKELNVQSVIYDVNDYLKKVFSKKTRITSHSFRQTLITELATAGVNTKIIQNLIGHSSVNTTLRYVRPSTVDIINCLHSVR